MNYRCVEVDQEVKGRETPTITGTDLDKVRTFVLFNLYLLFCLFLFWYPEEFDKVDAQLLDLTKDRQKIGTSNMVKSNRTTYGASHSAKQ